MAYNFKSIADVEVVAEPAESANVLIEENGVIKKTSKTAVGGEKTDMVIALTMRLDYDTPTADTTVVSIESGSLEAVAEALRDGRSPVVKCKRYYVTNGFDTSLPVVEGGVYDCDVCYYNGSVGCSFFASGYCIRIIMNIDDPEYLEVWVHPLTMTTIQVI